MLEDMQFEMYPQAKKSDCSQILKERGGERREEQAKEKVVGRVG